MIIDVAHSVRKTPAKKSALPVGCAFNRDLGGTLSFVELRDSTGRVQLAADGPNRNKKVHDELATCRSEYVIIAKGKGGNRQT